MKILSAEDIGYLTIDKLLEYYKECVIFNHKCGGSAEIENVIDDIEDSIHYRL